MPTNDNAVAGRSAHGAKNIASVAAAKYTAGPAERLLSRLDRVRKSGRGWTARCPAHEDRTASLSVTEGQDARVLLHCFAGCRAADVVAALGLELGDLFVPRASDSMSHIERAQLREFARQANWRAALNVLALEAKIISIVGHDLQAGRSLTVDDAQRLDEAVQRIDAAQEALNGRH